MRLTPAPGAMCWFRVYSEKFGEMPRSGISRETGANKAGWPDADE